MTPEAQRIAIAEACGYVWNDGPPTRSGGWTYTDYLNDLNACHEMEKVIPKEIFSRYMSLLTGIVSRDSNPERDHFANRSTATAAQRAEAFLKTLELWQD